MTERYDIAVVGAGVAGAMSAVKLSRRGYRVLLVDKAKRGRDKVCGCCLNPDALAALRDEGFEGLLNTATPLHHADLFAAGRSATLGLPRGVALSRRALDTALIEAAERAGCTVWDQAVGRVVGSAGADALDAPGATQLAKGLLCAPARDQCAVHGRSDTGARTQQPFGQLCGTQAPAGQAVALSVTRGGNDIEIHARVALVADGLAGSALAGHDAFVRRVRPGSKRGYGTHLPPESHDHPAGRITMRCGPTGYLGAVVLEDGSLDLAAAIDPDAVKSAGGIGPAVQQIVDASGQPLPIHQSLDQQQQLRWSATAPLTGGRPRRWSDRSPGVLLVGDSAGYVEPFTGEGMAWALAGAGAVVPIVERVVAEGWTDDAGAAWDAAYGRLVRRRQWRCRATAAMLRRPGLTAAAVGLLGALPSRLAPLVDRVVTPGRAGRSAPTSNREAACPL